MKTAGERIRHIRNERGLTLEQLAEKTGISKSFLWAVENNKNDISGEYLIRVSDALEASVEYILRGGGKDAEKQTPTLEIPRELIQTAEKLGLSFRETHALLQAQSSLVARRSNKQEVAMSAEHWEKLWDGIKDFIRDKALK